MSRTVLKAVDRLEPADRLLFSDDVRLWRVVVIRRAKGPAEGSRKVHLRSLDGATRLMLLRRGSDMVSLVVDE